MLPFLLVMAAGAIIDFITTEIALGAGARELSPIGQTRALRLLVNVVSVPVVAFLLSKAPATPAWWFLGLFTVVRLGIAAHNLRVARRARRG